MLKRKIMLSPDDRQAVDIVLDHAANSSAITRLTTDVAPGRVAAVTKLLDLLSEMPVIEPPHDLVSQTMDRIDRDADRHATHRAQVTMPPSAHMH